jgi:hypothetical protein
MPDGLAHLPQPSAEADRDALFLTNPRWEGDSTVVHGQTTRNFCPADTPAPEQARLIRQHLGAEDFVSVVMGQVHGRHTATVGDREIAKAEDHLLVIPETDALITEKRGVLLHVQTADCVPVLALDPIHGLLGAAHCGWRGTAKKLASKLVREMINRGADPERLEIWLGAAISGENYQVDADTLEKFASVTNWWPAIDHEKRRVDLRTVNRLQIARAGVPPQRMTTCPLCTLAEPGLLHSYRRDPQDPGRMHAVIGLRPR